MKSKKGKKSVCYKREERGRSKKREMVGDVASWGGDAVGADRVV